MHAIRIDAICPCSLARSHRARRACVLMHRKCILHTICPRATPLVTLVMLFVSPPHSFHTQFYCFRSRLITNALGTERALFNSQLHVGGALNANQICLPRLFVSYLLSLVTHITRIHLFHFELFIALGKNHSIFVVIISRSSEGLLDMAQPCTNHNCLPMHN